MRTNIISKSARRATRHVAGNGSLTVYKADAHRANRAAMKRVVSEIVKGNVDSEDADFMPSRTHMVTAWEVS